MEKKRAFRYSEQGEQEAEVIAYAPGDGELSFVARDLYTNCVTSPYPTYEECQQALAHRPDWEVYMNGPYFRARKVVPPYRITKVTVGVCSVCQQSGIELIYEDEQTVLQCHLNHAEKQCLGSYTAPEATYKREI